MIGRSSSPVGDLLQTSSVTVICCLLGASTHACPKKLRLTLPVCHTCHNMYQRYHSTCVLARGAQSANASSTASISGASETCVQEFQLVEKVAGQGTCYYLAIRKPGPTQDLSQSKPGSTRESMQHKFLRIHPDHRKPKAATGDMCR